MWATARRLQSSVLHALAVCRLVTARQMGGFRHGKNLPWKVLDATQVMVLDSCHLQRA